jgi:hypothetical protein
MSEHKLSETDWKRWVYIADKARKRFEERVLADAVKLAKGPGTSAERYAKLSKLLTQADDVIAAVFDDQKRTRAALQIATAVAEGVVAETELGEFSQESQAAIAAARESL